MVKGGIIIEKLQWLKDIRKEKNLTTYEVAEKSGISQTYYSAIENGIRGKKLPADIAKRIAGVLDFNWIRFFDN